MTTDVTCEYCGETVTKPKGEVNRSRRLGRRFYCNNTCQGLAGKQFPDVQRNCKLCESLFLSRRLGGKYTEYCSRSCASSGSMSDFRLEQARISGSNSENRSFVKCLKSREAWKYAEIEEGLTAVAHEFEYEIAPYVFDLAFPFNRLLVEFDGPDHLCTAEKDRAKDLFARSKGFRVIRVPVEQSSIIPMCVLEHIGFNSLLSRAA